MNAATTGWGIGAQSEKPVEGFEVVMNAACRDEEGARAVLADLLEERGDLELASLWRALKPVMRKARKTKSVTWLPEVVSDSWIAILPGQAVMLVGMRSRYHVVRDVFYCRVFHIGDVCEESSYNIAYHGTIAAISMKTIKITMAHRRKATCLDLATFSSRNHDFDHAASAQRNSEWMD